LPAGETQTGVGQTVVKFGLGAPDNNPVFQILGSPVFDANVLETVTYDKTRRGRKARAGRAFFGRWNMP
jgi:hypothetical protein